MTKENYLLLIWNQGGVPEVHGLYPDNTQTFEYIKSLFIQDVKDFTWEGGISLPENLDDESCVYNWYREQIEGADDYWQVSTLSPQDAPLI